MIPVKRGSVYFVSCLKQGHEIEGVVLHRVGFLEYFFLNRVRISTLDGTPVPKHGSSTSSGTISAHWDSTISKIIRRHVCFKPSMRLFLIG